MSKIKNGGLHQYGAEPFEQQQFGTAGVEGVKLVSRSDRYVAASVDKVAELPVSPSQTSVLHSTSTRRSSA